MRRGKSIIFVLAVICVLVGCGGRKAPDVSSVTIDKDGKISHQIVGQFEQNYYEKDGLMSLARERVDKYCSDNGADRVVLGEIEEEDGKVLMQFDYASCTDYSAFNNRELFVGTLDEAESRGYNLGYVAFTSSKSQPMEISDLEEPENMQIIIIGMKPSEEMVVHTYGKVLYVNQSATSDLNVAFLGKDSVNISYPAQEEGAQESVLSYIIFE